MAKCRVFVPWYRVALLIAALALLSAAQPHKPQPPKTLRLYVFDCGMLDNADISRYALTREEIGTHLMSVPAFLIVHPKGTLMWDVGAVPDANFKADGLPGTLNYATSLKPMMVQLREVGYAPAVAGTTEGTRHHVCRRAFHANHLRQLQRAQNQPDSNHQRR